MALFMKKATDKELENNRVLRDEIADSGAEGLNEEDHKMWKEFLGMAKGKAEEAGKDSSVQTLSMKKAQERETKLDEGKQAAKAEGQMSLEEQQKVILDAVKALEERETAANALERKLSMKEELTKRNLPTSLLEHMDFSSDESAKQALNLVTAMLKDGVGMMGATPKLGKLPEDFDPKTASYAQRCDLFLNDRAEYDRIYPTMSLRELYSRGVKRPLE